MQTVTIPIESDLEDCKVTHHDNFISVYENCFKEGQLDEFIDYYERGHAMGLTNRRYQYDTADQTKKNDTSINFETSHSMEVKWVSQMSGFLDYCHNILLPQYQDHWFSELKDCTRIYEGKVQKTVAGEGYHVFHCENMGRGSRDRVLAWMLYLNDVDEGGETEFLYQHVRFKPKRGDFLVWPGGFTHTHRGNPPISNDKYICTGWVEWS